MSRHDLPGRFRCRCGSAAYDHSHLTDATRDQLPASHSEAPAADALIWVCLSIDLALARWLETGPTSRRVTLGLVRTTTQGGKALLGVPWWSISYGSADSHDLGMKGPTAMKRHRHTASISFASSSKAIAESTWNAVGAQLSLLSPSDEDG